MKRLRKLLSAASAPAVWPALARGVVATMEHAAPLRAFSFKNIVDVGANKGQFAAFAASQWSDAELYCFEPLPAPRQRLKAVVGAVALGRAQVFDCALGAVEGEAVIHVASREDSSSLLPLAAEQKRLFDMTAAGEMTIAVRRLDEMAELAAIQNALLKIDVQGFELEVLKGAAGRLGAFDAIYVEMSYVELYEGQALADEVTAFLSAAGFALRSTFNDHIDPAGRRVQADALFVPSSRG